MGSGEHQLYADIAQDTANMVQEDWAYTMRRTMQEIVPGVFLGPYASAGKKMAESLKTAGITHIICVRQDVEKNLIKPHHEGQCEYLIVTLADSMLEPIIPKARESKRFIDKCLMHGGKVLVHCNDGMSRAPALVIAYLMETYCMDFKAALNHVQQKRFCVQPNDGFEQQLREFEAIYKASVEVRPRESGNGQLQKRGREEEQEAGEENEGVKSRVIDNRAESKNVLNNRAESMES